MYVVAQKSRDLLIMSASTGKKTPTFTVLVLVDAPRRAPRLFSQRPSSCSGATSGYGLVKKSLVHVPDLRQQRRKLLVLEAEGENLLRVDAAERAQAHQLHQHAGKHQVILRRHLKGSLTRPGGGGGSCSSIPTPRAATYVWSLYQDVRAQEVNVRLLEPLHQVVILHVGTI